MNIIQLPKSKIWVQVHEGKGRHAQKAGELMAGNSSMYMPALMHQLVTVATAGGLPVSSDENPLEAQDLNELAIKFEARPMYWFLDELHLKDYTELVTLVGN